MLRLDCDVRENDAAAAKGVTPQEIIVIGFCQSHQEQKDTRIRSIPSSIRHQGSLKKQNDLEEVHLFSSSHI